MSSCTGICNIDTATTIFNIKGKTKVIKNRGSYYQHKGHKYCSVCEKRVITDLTGCECCGHILRVRARAGHYTGYAGVRY